MRKKLLATIGLCVCTAFSFCACGRLGKEPEPTTAPSVNNGLSASVKVGNKTYFSVDGRGFAEDFPTEDVLDGEGRAVRSVDYLLYGKEKRLIEGYSEYEYDEAGNVKVRIKYDTLGNFVAEYRYETDEKFGKPSEISVYNSDGGLESRTEYTYVRVITPNRDPGYVYTEKTVTEYDGQGALIGTCEYEYYEQSDGSPKTKTYRDADGNITLSYDFDETGDYSYLHIYENGEEVETKKIG